MRSSSSLELFFHNEENPCLRSPRHPLVVFFHIPFALVLLGIYLTLPESTSGQTLYFWITICLYVSSAAYHAWRPNWLLRFVDQTLIAWYIVVLPVPFLYQEIWALPVLLLMLVLTAANKWFLWEPNYTAGSIIFFALGLSSFILVTTLGLKVLGTGFVSVQGISVCVATGFFIGKLYIYQKRKGRWIRNIWESPESGHCVLSVGVIIYTLLVTFNPV